MTTQTKTPLEHTGEYQAPAVITLGSLHDLTLGCNKQLGHSDGFTFQGQAIVCQST